MVRIVLNGEEKEVPEGLSVSGLLGHFELGKDRVAVERNGAIVKKDQWDSAKIALGDRLEVVTFVGGGA